MDDAGTRISGQAFLGQLSMNLMENLEKDYGEDFKINTAAIIVDVSWTDEDGDLAAQICYKATDRRRWVQEALFNNCARIARK